MNYFIGYYGDQIFLLWSVWWYKNYKILGFTTEHFSPLYAAPFGKGFGGISTEPITWGVYYFLSKYIDGILVYNFLIVLSFFLSFLFSYLLFKGYFHKLISIYLALSYSFSSYYLSQISNHLDLSQIWVLPFFLYIFLKKKDSENFKDYIFLGLLIGFISLISSYYGFFIYLFIAFFTLSSFLYNLAKSKVLFLNKMELIGPLLMLLVSSCIVFLMLKPYFIVNYLEKSSSTVNQELKTIRPLDDFITYSSRPWYYFLPSERNPLFGKFSTDVINGLASKNYFLFNNYFQEEHGGNFLGFGTLLLLMVSVPLCKRFGVKVIKGKFIFSLFFITFSFFILSMPPFFTLNGFKIYLPNYLIFNFFPMFRVMARLSIIILLLTLFISGLSLESMKKILGMKLFFIVLCLLTILNVSSAYIPVTVTDITSKPPVFVYLKENTPPNSIFAVYPYKKTNEALFWMRVHERGLANPKDYYREDFNSPKFTSKLITEEGLKNAKNLGVGFLVVFKNYNKEAEKFFTGTSMLIKQVEYSDSLVYKII